MAVLGLEPEVVSVQGAAMEITVTRQELLKELIEEAFQHGLDDLDMPVASPAPSITDGSESDPGSIGILVVMAGTAIVVLGLAAAVVIEGINLIVRAS